MIVVAINLLLSPFPNPPFPILQDKRVLVNGKNLGKLTLGEYYNELRDKNPKKALTLQAFLILISYFQVLFDWVPLEAAGSRRDTPID
jgi:hypothetical protein